MTKLQTRDGASPSNVLSRDGCLVIALIVFDAMYRLKWSTLQSGLHSSIEVGTNQQHCSSQQQLNAGESTKACQILLLCFHTLLALRPDGISSCVGGWEGFDPTVQDCMQVQLHNILWV